MAVATVSCPEVAAPEQRQLGEEICGMSVQTKCGEKAETETKRDRQRDSEREIDKWQNGQAGCPSRSNIKDYNVRTK